ncbi:MAG: helix-turn-helix transcriptional regulator [Fermentimonas sp.]|nr:helix-turn-helix transcriptional regulator [Fermentimonas sp.]
MNAGAKLTRRETQVGKLIAWGACKKTVADRLFISVHTVENHVRNIFEKTECRSVNEFSAWYFCTHFGISMELSPLKNIVAMCLIIIYISGDIMQSTDIFTSRSRRNSNLTERLRSRNRRDESDLNFSDVS